ncbi:MAG: hypothetical protein WC464_05680 [Bdellovibrionales bacterium]
MSSNILVSSSVTASGVPTTYSISTSHPKNETADEAIDIGNLDAQSSIITISDDGAVATSAISQSFVAKEGTVSLSEVFDNFVTEIFTRFQLIDSEGTVIADSQGTTEQIAAYDEWVEGTLAVSAGTYTVTATPETAYTGELALTVGSSERQGTSLYVDSSLTGSDTSEYYNFSLSGSNIKLDFDAGSNAKNVRVILYNEDGKIIADSDGNAYQKSKYVSLTSSSGLSADSGDYSIEVTYADDVDTTVPIDYNFSLYSGNSYAVVYKNTVEAQPYDGSARGSVEATSDAELYEASAYNKIITSAAQAVNIGWIQQDKSMLDVYSQLTAADNVEYYSFTFQQGNNLKLDFNPTTTTNEAGLRVQLMDATGSRVIADSGGTKAQREMYAKLTSSEGVDANTGNYIVRISYAEGAAKDTITYEFGIYSGSSYSAQYKTIASAQTYENAILTGELGSSTAASSAIAAYLTAQMNEDDDYLASQLASALKTLY